MPGRSPHRRTPPPPPLISRRSPGIRRRMRSPERVRSGPSGPLGQIRPSDYRGSTVRRSRSRSPIDKSRSIGLGLKRNLSPKHSRRLSPHSMRKHSRSRSKSPVNSPHLLYKSGPLASSSLDRYRSGPSDKERVLFRGPEGSISYDKNELKKISVDIIRKNRGPVDETVHINRAITNPEDIVIHRPGVGRPIGHRSEYESPRDRISDEYRRVVALNSEREREKVRSRDIRYSPPHFEERPQMYYPIDRERPRSPAYSSSRRSPPRDFFDMRDKVLDGRPGPSKDDLRHELELRKRDDGRYPERHGSYERERERIIEKRIEMPMHYEDRSFDRERRRELSPPRERRRGSIDSIRPPRDGWERDHDRIDSRERSRKRSLSMERPREDMRIRGNGRFEHFDHIEDRNRRFPFKPEIRDYHKGDGYIPSPPTRGRGGPSMRRGHPDSFRGGSRGRPFSRGSRGFRGSHFSSRGGPPRGSSLGMRGGFSRK